jgi:hypothetical protein
MGVDSGVVKTPVKTRWTHWMEYPGVSYTQITDDSRPVTEGVTAAAIDKLAAMGIITAPGYWKAQCETVKYLDALFVKWADSLKKI